MRTLHKNELTCINGGINTGGYNFSFIVENTVTGALVGIPFTLLTGDPYFISLGMMVFGGYAVAMATAKGLDSLFFEFSRSTF